MPHPPIYQKTIKRDNNMKIAIASSNNKDVDLHFGKARNLIIYNLKDGNADKVENREVVIDDKERHQWKKVLETISDCEVVICVQAGLKSKLGIEEAGIKVVE
ncbi:MAG: NifB/NifX family molybdenum-iron cluster-binding protein, partial [Methanobacteriaceae archaeon]